LEEIARGGMGVIYKARETGLDRVVAFKMILDSELGTEESVQRFHREARAAAALDHPNIVPVYQNGEHEGRHYFTMAFIEGATLKATVLRDGLPTPHRAVALLLAVADAVEFAHQKGILHRDLKPENVLIDQQGRPRVTDFGLAKRVAGDPHLTTCGQILGTPCYLPPEQAKGDPEQVGPEADVYGLGGILYFLLTGRPPFQGQTSTEVLFQVMVEPPAPPRQHNPKVPEGLEAICLKCLEKEPADRYPSAAALAAALAGWAAQTKTVPPLNTLKVTPHDDVVAVERTPGWKSREIQRPPAKPAAQSGRRPRRVWVALAAGGLLVAVAAGVGIWLASRTWKTSPINPDADSGAGGTSTGGGSAVVTPQTKSAAGAPPVTRPSVPVTPQTKPSRVVASQVVDLIPPDRCNDFDLKVEMVGGRPGPDKVIRLKDGDTVKFRVTTQQDAYVEIWSVDADGTFERLFPNDEDRNSFFRTGEERLVPEQPPVDAQPSAGTDRVWVLASTVPWPSVEDLSERRGVYLRLKGLPERQEWVRRVRGFRLRNKVRLADEVLQFQVEPAR
jgi:serine/threonine protein kinase